MWDFLFDDIPISQLANFNYICRLIRTFTGMPRVSDRGAIPEMQWSDIAESTARNAVQRHALKN